jgi:hypothetical protein
MYLTAVLLDQSFDEVNFCYDSRASLQLLISSACRGSSLSWAVAHSDRQVLLSNTEHINKVFFLYEATVVMQDDTVLQELREPHKTSADRSLPVRRVLKTLDLDEICVTTPCGLQSRWRQYLCFSETLVFTYKSTRRHSLSEQHRHLHRRGTLRSDPHLGYWIITGIIEVVDIMFCHLLKRKITRVRSARPWPWFSLKLSILTWLT